MNNCTHNNDSEDFLELSTNDPNDSALNDLSIIGRLISDRKINNSAIIAVLETTWNLGNNAQIKVIDINTITCKFTDEESRDAVLNAGPWVVTGATLCLRYWDPTLTLDEVQFTTCKLDPSPQLTVESHE